MKSLCWLTVAAVFLSGCDGWKRFDEHAGLLLVPNVFPTTVDGKQMIEMRSGKTVVVIDPVGGRITDIHRRKPEGPNALGRGGWAMVLTPDLPEITESRWWQVDGDSQTLTLLSDTKKGLRFRMTYRFAEDDVLEITSELKNTTGEPIHASAKSLIHGDFKWTSTGNMEHDAGDGFWLTIEHAGKMSETDPVIPPHTSMIWRETWKLQPGKK